MNNNFNNNGKMDYENMEDCEKIAAVMISGIINIAKLKDLNWFTIWQEEERENKEKDFKNSTK